MKFVREQNDLEISKAREMMDIETAKFENTVKAIGSDTLRAIAVSGPEMQVFVYISLSLSLSLSISLSLFFLSLYLSLSLSLFLSSSRTP